MVIKFNIFISSTILFENFLERTSDSTVRIIFENVLEKERERERFNNKDNDQSSKENN